MDASVSAQRSFEDVEILLKVIRHFYDKYGGDVYDMDKDYYGFFENTVPKYSVTEKQLELVYRSYTKNLQVVVNLIEDGKKVEDPKKVLYKTNLSIMRNNTLIPYMVSALENFLKDYLTQFLKTNKEARNLIYKQKKKQVGYLDLKELLEGKASIVDYEMKEYSFQNFDAANTAYNRFAEFDLYKNVLTNKFAFDEERTIVSVLNEVIERRHSIIHEAGLFGDLDAEQMRYYHKCLSEFGEFFVDRFGGKKKIKTNLLRELLIMDGFDV